MILPPYVLNGFTYYVTNPKYASGGWYDELILHYRPSGFFNVEKQKVMKFTRYTNKNNKYEASDDFIELKKQLDAIIKGEWMQVPKETYEFLEKEHPDKMI